MRARGTIGVVAVAVGLTAVPPAFATPRTFVVTLLGGAQVTVTVDVPPGTPADQIQFPGVSGPVVSVQEVTPPPGAQTGVEVQLTPTPAPGSPATTPGETSGGRPRAERRSRQRKGVRRPAGEHGRVLDLATALGPVPGAPEVQAPGRRPDGSPTTQNPAFTLALPGAAPIGVPNFFIDRFRIPPFLLPIYQAAGIEYGVRWEVLAAINEIETDYGRNLNVSSAGAVGWMQFLPSSWKRYGVDANNDGVKDPYNPVDAVFAAARYLEAAGADTDLRRAIFAYNHADWYVDSVLLRARLIGALPANFVTSLTGLTQGRFPVDARATYADDIADRAWAGRRGAEDSRRSIAIFSKEGAPVIAVNDGRVLHITKTAIEMRDAYGNTYTYARLGRIARAYRAERPASAGKARLFADPFRRRAARAGGDRQVRPLRPGVRVAAGTVLGRLGPAKQLEFSIRPAGRGAPRIDPKPILDGWKLLETSELYRAQGENPFTAAPPSIGQVLLMGKEQLQQLVLDDPRVEIYACGRQDVRLGRIDRRVLATLEYLSLSGFKPTVTALECGHSYLTASGNVSEHSSGSAVDIARINGVPILGHQGPGSITDIVVRRLVTLQGLMRPHQIITLMKYPDADNTLALSDHDDHIHVGFQPLYGTSPRADRVLDTTLKPRQWIELVDRLGKIDNPRLELRP